MKVNYRNEMAQYNVLFKLNKESKFTNFLFCLRINTKLSGKLYYFFYYTVYMNGI